MAYRMSAQKRQSDEVERMWQLPVVRERERQSEGEREKSQEL